MLGVYVSKPEFTSCGPLPLARRHIVGEGRTDTRSFPAGRSARYEHIDAHLGVAEVYARPMGSRGSSKTSRRLAPNEGDEPRSFRPALNDNGGYLTDSILTTSQAGFRIREGSVAKFIFEPFSGRNDVMKSLEIGHLVKIIKHCICFESGFRNGTFIRSRRPQHREAQMVWFITDPPLRPLK